MKRLLACAVATELVFGSLSVVILTNDPAAPRSVSAARTAVTGDGRVQPDSAGSSVQASSSHNRRPRAGSPGPATASGAGRGDFARSGSSSTRAAQISFKLPVDFATGAEPSSAAFNRASGDQMALQVAHALLPDSVAVGDFDHDGNDDVAQTNVIAGSVSIFIGDGRGGFDQPDVQHVGVHPSFIVAKRLDPDEHLDLAVANTGSGNVAILRGDGHGRFRLTALVPVPSPRNVAVGTFDDDDVPDLAVASAGPACARLAPRCSDSVAPAGGVAIFTGTTDPAGGVSFEPAQLIPLTHSRNGQPVGANFVAVGDFDGSGHDDVAVAVGTSANAGDRQDGTTALTGDDLLIFLNRHEAGPGPFDRAPAQDAIRVGATPDAIAVGDWNGDTHPDLAVLGNASGDATTLLGDRDGHFTRRATNVTVGTLPRSIAVGDFDDDGISDLVTANFGASTISVLQGNDDGSGRGDGTFRPAVDFWTGDAPTEVAVGHFDGDARLDVVAARLRGDQLSLLANDSPQPSDGVAIHRDTPYVDPANDPFAAHHTLDVYVPPPKSASFAGSARPHPVVFFAHGGGGVSLDKSGVSYLMRSLALEGLVVVSTNYRLGTGLEAQQAQDVVAAFRWTRDNVGTKPYGGDPSNVFAFGYSAGAAAVARLATDAATADEQKHIRGFVLAGSNQSRPGDTPELLPSLLLNGDEGLERALAPLSAVFSADAQRRGADSEHLVVPGRDHLTILSDMALAGDRARAAMLEFLRRP